MSDFGDDIDDELLALATEDSDKKRKRRQSAGGAGTSAAAGGGIKRRKADASRNSYDTPESEEDEANPDPYPLEGKYKDEDDRQTLMAMSEVDRERILADRADHKQLLEDEKILSQMVREQRGAVVANGDDDRVSAAAKRQHTARGATKEKSKKLDELKARRKAKDEKKKTRQLSPKREHSSSPMDMEISDEESEDGQITKYDEEEEKLDKLNSAPRKSDQEDQPAELADLERCRLTRDSLAKYCMAPWFQEYVQGAFVRYLIGGNQDSGAVYRICEVSNLAADLVKPYKINDTTVNQAFELKHGKSIRVFNMDKVSNGLFVDKEFERFKSTLVSEEVKLPTKKQLERKVAQMEKLITQPVTESDITAMLARKSQVSKSKSAALLTMERSRFTQARTLAQRRMDFAEVAEIDKKLEELNANAEFSPVNAAVTEAEDKLAKVNERNRRANVEAVRRAELAEAERKRKERKLAAMQGVDARSAAPHDPSARLKTVPRLFKAATPTGSMPGTPVLTGTPMLGPTAANVPRQVSPLPSSALSGKPPGKAAFIDVDVDLGDF
ncbi:hypothetical protein AX14_002107 [Amanita brunnescens Koide BX004]|nr:hypothetical protein AX14_002107 [Amanita brunnescens Koide BX004]